MQGETPRGSPEFGNSLRRGQRATDVRSHAADRTIACVRKAIEELAAGRPPEALLQVADAYGRLLALCGMIEAQILRRISSFGPPRLAGWTAAILLASAMTAFADCGDLLQRFNQALEQRSLAEVVALEKQIAADA